MQKDLQQEQQQQINAKQQQERNLQQQQQINAKQRQERDLKQQQQQPEFSLPSKQPRLGDEIQIPESSGSHPVWNKKMILKFRCKSPLDFGLENCTTTDCFAFRNGPNENCDREGCETRGETTRAVQRSGSEGPIL